MFDDFPAETITVNEVKEVVSEACEVAMYVAFWLVSHTSVPTILAVLTTFTFSVSTRRLPLVKMRFFKLGFCCSPIFGKHA